MGNCNGSKTQDIDTSRKRTPAAVHSPPQKGYSTSSKPIGAPSPFNAQAPSNVAESYSEKRVEESDILKNLVEKTSQNLIDVSQSTVGLDARATENRRKDYRERETVRSALNTHQELALYAFVLPAPSKENPSPADLLSVKTIKDKDAVAKHVDNVTGAMRRMNVQDCGDLVVPFGSLAGAT